MLLMMTVKPPAPGSPNLRLDWAKACRLDLKATSTNSGTYSVLRTGVHARVYVNGVLFQSFLTNPTTTAENFTVPLGCEYIEIYTKVISGVDVTPASLTTGIELNVVTASIERIVKMSEWEDAQLRHISFGNMAQLVSVPNFLPSTILSFRRMFWGCVSFNDPNISQWDTSNIRSFDTMFYSCFAFNQDIGNWNVSKVTIFTDMFSSCYAFNQPLGNWNVVSGVSFNSMFQSARAFNQNINSWNVSRMATAAAMFQDARLFNQPLDNWNTANLTNMASMFYGAVVFNQNISNWNVSRVTNRAGYDATTPAWLPANKPRF